jgi:hypothetical protein
MADYFPFDAWWISRGPSEAIVRPTATVPSGVTNGGARSVSLLETVPLVRTAPDGFHKSALALIEAGTVWRKKITLS